MAKKVRRARRLSAAQTYQPAESPATSTVTGNVQAPGRSASRTVDFREEYRYILSDLQRIGILAAAILGGLVILSFFIK